MSAPKGTLRALGDACMCGGVLVMAASSCVSLATLHCGLAIAAFGALLARPPLHRLPGFMFAVAFAAWQLASMVVGQVHGGQSLMRTGTGTVFIWSSAYLGMWVLGDRRHRTWAASLIAIGLLASIVLSALQFCIGFGGARPFRVSARGPRFSESAGFMPLHLTQGFILTEFLLFFLCDRTRTGATGLAAWAVRLAAPIGIALTCARSSFLGVACGTAAFVAAKSKRLLLLSALLLCGILAIEGAVLWAKDAQQLGAMARFENGRTTIWRVAAQMIVEHPWFGVGGSDDFKRENDVILRRLYPDGSQDQWLQAPHAHNSFLAIACEHGVPALLLYLSFVGALLRHLYAGRGRNPVGWQLGCGLAASALVAGQFEDLSGHSVTAYALYLCLALALALDPELRPRSTLPAAGR